MEIKEGAENFILFLLLHSLIANVVGAESSFFLSFSKASTLSKVESAEFLEPMPDLKAFTVCHWDKPKYFNDQTNYIWNYCVHTKQMERTKQKIDCFGLDKRLVASTANRHMEIHSYFDYRMNTKGGKVELGWYKIKAQTKPYQHRKWQHYCWSYSSITGKNYLYWNGIMIANETVPEPYRMLWKGSGNGTVAAFIIGQEQDDIRSGYQPEQAFMGDIAELNVWDHLLDAKNIYSIATCKLSLHGNVKKWDISKLNINEAKVHNVTDNTLFCQPERNLVIFPERMSLSMAKRICTVHGGKIATPATQKENDGLIEIVKNHQTNCINTNGTEKRNWGKLVWLGVKRINSTWYDVRGDLEILPINYSRWQTTYFTDNMDCAFLQSDGSWYYGPTGSCPMQSLCTICSIEDTPIFTIKGLCETSNHDWNFYMSTNSKNEISYYEGYKDSRISKERGNGTWGNKAKTFRTQLISNTKTQYPIGRMKWNVYDENCGLNTSKFLTLSQCEFGKQFTCRSGHCIGIEGNCDGKIDCADASDETHCHHIRIPRSYKQIDPPSTSIYVNVSIESIHDINTIEMVLEMTQVIAFTWHDDRLTFTNLRNGISNMVSDGLERQVWTPFDRVVHEQALIGKLFTNDMELYIEGNKPPIEMDSFDAFEDRLYDSRNNSMTAMQRSRGSYDCNFELEKFPFDTQICQFQSYLIPKKDTVLHFTTDDNSIKYIGKNRGLDFEVQGVQASSNMEGNHSFFIFTIKMRRDYRHDVISLFIPSWLIWILAYFTFYIDLKNFNNRFMGSVTSLLVLASLLNSMQSKLPKTSYFKFVDFWFLWYIINSIIMIGAHVLIVNVNETELSALTPLAWPGNKNDISKDQMRRRKRANKIAKLIFPLLTIPFNLFYFMMHLI